MVVGQRGVVAAGHPASAAAGAAALQAGLAGTGVPVSAMQAYVFGLLAAVVGSTSDAAARFLVEGRPPREGELLRDEELADSLDRLGADGAAPFYTGDIGRAVSDR